MTARTVALPQTVGEPRPASSCSTRRAWAAAWFPVWPLQAQLPVETRGPRRDLRINLYENMLNGQVQAAGAAGRGAAW
jgi:hypothetical protein